jgi:eukaryotic-like serine/threonine-protein kinase
MFVRQASSLVMSLLCENASYLRRVATSVAMRRDAKSPSDRNIVSTAVQSPPNPESLDATVIVTPPSDRSTVVGEDFDGQTWIGPASDFHPVPGTSPATTRILGGVQQDGEGAMLRSRLQTAAIISLGCLLAFFVRAVFVDEPLLLVVRSIALIVTVGCLGLLVTPRSQSTNELRRIELMLFGQLCVLVVYLEILFLQRATASGDAPQQVTVMFSGTLGLVIMMLAYGMLMPSGWRRTAMMMIPPIGAFAVSIVAARYLMPSVGEVINAARTADFGMALVITGVVSTYGSHVISTLRREARRARELGRYNLKQILGEGGMGQVYLAEHQLLKRPCAIKVIRPCHGVDRAALERFEREVQTTARLSHWNTVEIFDYGHTADGTFYYVMEFMRGLNLSELVKRFGPLSPGRAIHFLSQTCWALQEAHNHGLIHRDIKPANIFAAKRGGVYDVTKLFDFGLVLLRTEGENLLSLLGPGRATPFAGSPLYMSPEQTAGLKLDARSDIYSLGAVGYYLLTGRPPFDGNSVWSVMVSHARDVVTPPSCWNPSIPRDLERVILRCLEKEPGMRYRSPRELAEALTACADAGAWSYETAGEWWYEHAAEIDPTLLNP